MLAPSKEGARALFDRGSVQRTVNDGVQARTYVVEDPEVGGRVASFLREFDCAGQMRTWYVAVFDRAGILLDESPAFDQDWGPVTPQALQDIACAKDGPSDAGLTIWQALGETPAP